MAMFKKRDPEAALQRERAALAAAKAKAAELQRERDSKLIETDGFDELWRLDRELAELHQREAVHVARIEAFEREAADRERERRERERAEAIEKILVPAVARCEALAKDVDATLAKFSAVWGELLKESRAVNQDWPAAVPRPPSYAYLSIGDALNRVVRAVEPGRTHYGNPLPLDADRLARLAQRAGPIAPAVTAAGASFIERIKSMTPSEPEPAAAPEKAA